MVDLGNGLKIYKPFLARWIDVVVSVTI